MVSTVPLGVRTGTSWQKVDLSLTRQGDDYAPVRPAVPVTLPGTLASAAALPHGLALRVRGAATEGRVVAGRTVLYANTAQDTDVVLTPTNSGVEQSTILRSQVSPEDVRMDLTLPAGTQVHVLRDGAVDLVQAKSTIASIPAPHAVDAQGTSIPVQMTVTPTGEIHVTVRHRNLDVAYPVNVDPMIVIPSRATIGGWRFVNQSPGVGGTSSIFGSITGTGLTVTTPAGAYGDHGVAGYTWQPPNGYQIAEASFQNITGSTTPTRTLSDLPDYVNVYQLLFTCSDGRGSGGVVSYGSVVLPRGESYTWQSTTTPDGYCGDTLEVRMATNAGGTYNFSQTGSVGTVTALLHQAGTAPTERLGGRNPSEPNIVPCVKGKPVDCATGNQYEQLTDLAVGGLGLGLKQERTYNSQAAVTQPSSGTFGFGWTGSYTERLVLDASAKTATVYQANGSTVPFAQNADETFSPPAWVQSTLTATASGYRFTLPNHATLLFTSAGALSGAEDRNGNTTVVTRDGQGRVSRVTDPAGRSLVFTYDSGGRLGKVADPIGRAVTYAYDGVGNLVTVTRPDGAVQKYAYDASHQLTAATDPRGGITRTQYDASNRVISQTDALNRTRTWSYAKDETVITEPNGTVTDQFFHFGQPTRVVRGRGTSVQSERRTTYDATNAPISVTDGRGKTTRYEYDGAGNRVSVTDPLERTVRVTYNTERDILTEQSPTGITHSYTYDAHGNRLSDTLTSADGTKSQRTTFDYDAKGQMIRRTDQLGHTTSYTYNAAGDNLTVTTPLGHTTSMGYDGVSRLTSLVSANGNEVGASAPAYKTTWTLDAASRPTATTDPLGRQSRASYDANGNLTRSTDAAGRTSTFTYDAENQQTSSTAPDGSTSTTTYDAAGGIASETDAGGHTTTYTTDPLGRVTSATDPLGRTTSYVYDAADNVVNVKKPSGISLVLNYDAAGQLTSRVTDRTDTVGFSYDGDGRRTNFGDTFTTYDSLGRLASTGQYDTGETTYAYDAAGRVTSIGYPANAPNGSTAKTPSGLAVTKTLDDDGRIVAIDDGLQHHTAYTYDAEGNITGVVRPDGSTERDSRNAVGQLTALTDTRANGYTFSAAYAYNGGGQTTTIDESANTLGSTLNFTYDQAGRLASNGRGNTFSYDTPGNLTRKPNAADFLPGSGLGPLPVGVPSYTTTSQSFDAANQLTQTVAGTDPATTFTYDADGQRATRVVTKPASPINIGSRTRTTTYTYNKSGQLTTYNLTNAIGGSSSVFYDYDLTGLRKSWGTTSLLFKSQAWDRATPTPQLLVDGTTGYVYGPDGLPLEAVTTNGTTIFHHDGQGSTRALTTTDGTTVTTYAYDAYGALQGNTQLAATLNPFLYRGQYTDADTGLQYLRARYYEPATGQFLTRDPLVNETGEPYAYASGDPVNLSDPSGLDVLGLSIDPNSGLGHAIQRLAGVTDRETLGVSGFLRDLLPGENLDRCSSQYRLGRSYGTAALATVAGTVGGGIGFLGLEAVGAPVAVQVIGSGGIGGGIGSAAGGSSIKRGVAIGAAAGTLGNIGASMFFGNGFLASPAGIAAETAGATVISEIPNGLPTAQACGC